MAKPTRTRRGRESATPDAIRRTDHDEPPSPTSASDTASEAETARSAISLIRELQSGRMVGSHLSITDRRRVVEHLTAEGYSVSEIAEVVKVVDRTVIRDREAIREQNALHPDPAMTPRVVGQLVTQAEASIARLRRLGRDKDSPAAVRVEAELGAWKVAQEAVQSLQRLGYLPTAAQQIQGQFLSATVSVDADHELAGLQQELARLQGIVAESSGARRDRSTTTEVDALFAAAHAKLRLADARATITKLSGAVADLNRCELIEPADITGEEMEGENDARS